MKKKTVKTIMLLILFTIVLIFLFVNISPVWEGAKTILNVLAPFIWGFVLAYIINFIMNAFEYQVFKNMGKEGSKLRKARRPLSLIISYIIFFGVLTLLLVILIPQLVDSVSTLVNSVPEYARKVANFAETTIKQIDKTFGLNLGEQASVKGVITTISGGNIIQTITNAASWLFPRALSTILTTATGVYNLIIGIIISIYVLLTKEQLVRIFKKLIVAIFPKKGSKVVFRVCKITDQKCGKFITGKIIEALFLGVIYFIVLNIFDFEYAPLIAVIMTVTNLIPFFGCIIGAIPSAFLLLVENPIHCIWFIVIVVAVQAVEGNTLSPKLLGDSVGVSSFWVLFAVIVGGGLFGVPGMLLGVPVFAVIYTLARDYVEILLRRKADKQGIEDENNDGTNSDDLMNDIDKGVAEEMKRYDLDNKKKKKKT